MAASFFSQRYVLPEGHACVPVRLINLGVESIECGRRKRRMRQKMGREEKEERSSLDIKNVVFIVAMTPQPPAFLTDSWDLRGFRSEIGAHCEGAQPHPHFVH